MRAAVVRRFASPPEVEIETRPIPLPAADEVRVAVSVAAVSFVDALIAEGGYQLRPELPWIPGSECAGVIDAVGTNVQGWRVGDRVCALAWAGVMAEYLCVPAENVLRVADTILLDAAAVVRVAYTTAWHALVDRAQARAGERLLVLGAGGAVGSAAVAIGHYLGLRVTAVSRGEITGRFDLVIDPVGGAALRSALPCLDAGGRYCVIGFASGEIPEIKVNRLLLGETALIGVSVGAFTARAPDQARANAEQILGLVAQRALPAPRIKYRFALDQAAEAFALARGTRGSGRIVIEF